MKKEKMSKYFNTTYIILYMSITVIVNLLSKIGLYKMNLYMIPLIVIPCLLLGQIDEIKEIIKKIHINILKSTVGQYFLCRLVIIEATVYDIGFLCSIGLGIFLFGIVYMVLLSEDFILLISSHLFLLILLNYGRYRYHFLNTTNLKINKNEDIDFEMIFSSINDKLNTFIVPKYSYRHINLHGASQLLREFLKNPAILRGAALGATLTGGGVAANEERNRIFADRALDKKLALDERVLDKKLAFDERALDKKLALDKYKLDLDRDKLALDQKISNDKSTLDLFKSETERIERARASGPKVGWFSSSVKEEEYSYLEILLKLFSSFF
jgi:hypothetical protein